MWFSRELYGAVFWLFRAGDCEPVFADMLLQVQNQGPR